VKPSQITIISPRSQAIQEFKPSPIKIKKEPKVISLELLHQSSSQKDVGHKSDFHPNRENSNNLRQKLQKMREFNNMNNYK
jgi:hypothetical protein